MLSALETRRAHVRYWMGLLETCPHYEFGLAAATPDLSLGIKSTVMAALRSARSDELGISGDHLEWGPRRIRWLDESSALQFVVDFEAAWDAIGEPDRTKSEVLSWLSAQLARVS